LSIAGGIQPAVLNRALTGDHWESGLAARFLFACPPRRPKQWTEDDIDPKLENELSLLFDSLYELEPTIDPDGISTPLVVSLSADAKQSFVNYCNDNGKEQLGLDLPPLNGAT